MMLVQRIAFILLFGLCALQGIQAEETDQFTLPPNELADLGPAASTQVYEVLDSVRVQTNAEIRRLLPRSQRSRHAASQLALRLNDAWLIHSFYKKTGPGFPRWFRGYRLSNQNKPTQYREILPWKTVYWLAFSQSPLSLISLTPTINMYGYYFGTDKLGHFFMQGHTYYSLYFFFLSHGQSAQHALATTITIGQIIEQSYLGTLVNGIYSNADLSANYAGWKFYMNFAHNISIDKVTLPPILVLKGNQWEFTKPVNKEHFLKKYLSDNFNEALNPSRYAFTRNQIRRQVKKRCAAWVERQSITPSFIKAKLEETRLWHGEPYGHWLPAGNAVTLNTCFGGR